ncbi:MAG: beta-ketoacyl-[acyl-carrier-protein] synthase family protein [Deltaproteobacteria bacterium]|nr:beta-ketoacyl-[acyl-carrier-protein] synthase family protein [Candidatus Tharpella aukensis]
MDIFRSQRRVAVTGMGAVSPFGRGVTALISGLVEGRSAIKILDELKEYGGLRTRLAALVPGVDGKEIPRSKRRSMSRQSIFAVLAAQEALAQAALPETEYGSGRYGVVVGTTISSLETSENFFADHFRDKSFSRMKTSLFFKTMNHSAAANVAHFFGLEGRLLAPAAACATGCQALGYAYEMIASGVQDVMVCGGTEEFHPLSAATFDLMNAASFRYNDRPELASRPFDRERDGVVCGEGAGILVLEDLQSAQERGAEILAEISGFATLTETGSIAEPSSAAMQRCMALALADAGVEAGSINYINAHATATEKGDTAEAQALLGLFGDQIPVSSLKGHLGHTLAASGGLETIATIEMMCRGELIPTRNLDEIDPRCQGPRIFTAIEKQTTSLALKNNFALGGVNCSLVIRAGQ